MKECPIGLGAEMSSAKQFEAFKHLGASKPRRWFNKLLGDAAAADNLKEGREGKRRRPQLSKTRLLKALSKER